MDKEIMENNNIENIDEEVKAAQESQANEDSSTAEVTEAEWTAIKREKAEPEENAEKENKVPKPDVMPEAVEEPKIEVLSDGSFKPVKEVNEDILGRSSELMAAEAKEDRKAAKKEALQKRIARPQRRRPSRIPQTTRMTAAYSRPRDSARCGTRYALPSWCWQSVFPSLCWCILSSLSSFNIRKPPPEGGGFLFRD